MVLDESYVIKSYKPYIDYAGYSLLDKSLPHSFTCSILIEQFAVVYLNKKCLGKYSIKKKLVLKSSIYLELFMNFTFGVKFRF